MMHYLTQWAHLYVVHFGTWISFVCAATIHKKGLPQLKNLPNLLKTAIITAAVLSVFSSHSHHYLSNVIPDTKILHENKGN